jgi:UDP-N-acetylglucosamine 2-epimerase (non-hydrolysing)
MLLDLVVGARPNFIKVAPIIDAIKAAQGRGIPLKWRLIHTGQHYDANMSGVFFQQLGLPAPDVNLGVGAGTQAEQTGAIMIRYEQVLSACPPAVCVVVGDVNSTMACAIAAKKMGVKVAHVEGGIRSGDRGMPEEINRLVTDSITDWFFTTSRMASQNLRSSGVAEAQIFFVGNTMIDTLQRQLPRLQPPALWRELGLCPKRYIILTLHRPSNVDNTETLSTWLTAIAKCCRKVPVVFPVHPRTAGRMKALSGIPTSFHFAEPLPYNEFNYLVKHAKAVITDSGGITEEATVFGVPCMTLRDSTERPETILDGTNELIGTNPAKLKEAFERLFQGNWKTGKVPELWDGQAAVRIVEALTTKLELVKAPLNTMAPACD